MWNEGKKQKLIFSWPYLSWGGAQIFFLNLSKSLRDSFEITFMMPAGSSPEVVSQIENENFPIHFWGHQVEITRSQGLIGKIRVHLTKVFGELRYVIALLRISSKESIIHLELAPWQSILPLLLLSRRRTVFATIHNRLGPVSGLRKTLWILKFKLASQFDGIYFFTANADARESMRSLMPANMLENTVVLHANVDLPEIERLRSESLRDRSRLRELLGIQDSDFVIVTTGQFIDRKGRKVLGDAAVLLGERGLHPRMFWLSDTQLDDDGMKLTRSKNPINVVRPGDIGGGREAAIRFLGIGDVFVLPSLFEGLPISLLEAMAYGIPCVSTNVNGIPEAIDDGHEGILVEAGNPHELADAIIRITSDGEAAKRMGRHSIERIRSTFTSEEVARIAASEYKKRAKERSN
jgi:glycosyltransferase involved in cell wall biosynthesis